MVAWKKIMGEFEVGHWMGAQKSPPYICFEKKMNQHSANGGKKKLYEKLNKKNASTFGKWRQKKTI